MSVKKIQAKNRAHPRLGNTQFYETGFQQDKSAAVGTKNSSGRICRFNSFHKLADGVYPQPP